MKKNDDFTLENEKYEDDARAVKESELLPIFEAMDLSGDIQPLEDFEIEEPSAVEFQSKKKTDSKNQDKKRRIDLKKTPNFSDSYIIKKLTTIIPFFLIIVGVVVLGVYLVAHSGKNTAPVRAIYSSDRKTYLNLDNDKTYDIDDAQDIRVSDDGMRVYYSKNTTFKTGKFDIKYINIGKTSSLKRRGGSICNGADEGWTTNSNGSFVCYSVTKSGIKRYYIYSAETGKSEPLSSNIDEVFLPSTGDVIYFTRRNGTIYSLHRMRYGENSQNVASEIDFVKSFSSDKGFEIIYTVGTGKGKNVDVFSVKNLDVPIKVCEDVSEVYINEYVCGGNLYYFKKKTASVNWEDFIDDPYREYDARFKRPSESDYMTEYGFIFKRFVLDKSAYQAASAKYSAKLKRDAIRAELDKIDFGLAMGGEYDCYVYNSSGSKLLATGVSLKNIISFSPENAPTLIFRKSVINVKKRISMNELVNISKNMGAAAAGDYVRENIANSFKLSDNCIYARYDGSKVVKHTIKNYESKSVQFFIASPRTVYVLNDGKLYPNSVSSTEFKKGEMIAEDVVECMVNGSFVYYKRSVTADNLSLYRYSPETGEQHICDNVYSYAVLEGDNVMVFSHQEENLEVAMIGIYNGKKYEQVDKNVSMSHFIYNESAFAYIKDVGESDVTNAGEMCIYFANGKHVSYNKDVTDIVYLKDDLSYKKVEKH